jgi:hypothetical protein
MADDTIHKVDGFVMCDGEFVSLDDSDRVLSRIKEHCSDKGEIFSQLNKFVLYCSRKGDDASAHAYAEKMFLYADSVGEKAYCLLCMGQFKERAGDFKEAEVPSVKSKHDHSKE